MVFTFFMLKNFFIRKAHTITLCTSFIRIKPIFAAKNSVKPIGIYIFLAKDLVISKKNTNFALSNDNVSSKHAKHEIR